MFNKEIWINLGKELLISIFSILSWIVILFILIKWWLYANISNILNFSISSRIIIFAVISLLLLVLYFSSNRENTIIDNTIVSTAIQLEVLNIIWLIISFLSLKNHNKDFIINAILVPLVILLWAELILLLIWFICKISNIQLEENQIERNN